MKIFLFILAVFIFTIHGSWLFAGEAEDPLRGGDLSRHLTGPVLEQGALKGKVVFFEYWGYN